MIDESLNPPADVWEDYQKEIRMDEAIRYAAENILLKGSKTVYQEIYDAIYEILEPEVEEEHERFKQSISAFG